MIILEKGSAAWLLVRWAVSTICLTWLVVSDGSGDTKQALAKNLQQIKDASC